MPHAPIIIDTAPAIEQLIFRHFHGESDYASMAAVLTASDRADHIERHVTPEQLATAYGHLTNCDLYQDLLLAESAGEVIGYSRGQWRAETSTGLLYELTGFLMPAWRRQGIGRALLLWTEARMWAVAATHPPDQAKFFQADTAHHQMGKARLLESVGYQPLRYFYEMVRPTLDEIPDWPLPAGIEIRAVLPEHYRALWQSIDETSQDEWGYTQPTEAGYEAWLADPHFQPQLWQVAWDTVTHQIVGHVLTFIDAEENQALGRQRGYTEGIGVERHWRRRGLARALIAHSLRAQHAAGMSESALAVDGDSVNATRLYARGGFRVVKQDTIYRKPL